MKKIFSLLLVIVLSTMIFAGCAEGPQLPNATEGTTAATESKDENKGAYKDSYEDVINYMKDAGYILSDDDKNKPIEMKAEIIGATKGYSYKCADKNIKATIEIYQYDLSKLNDTAKGIIEELENRRVSLYDGDVELEGRKALDGKYVMMYKLTDSKDSNETLNEIGAHFEKFYPEGE